MDLLKKLNEDAAGGSCGGGAVAAVQMPLFKSMVKRQAPAPEVKGKKGKKAKKKGSIGLRETFVAALKEQGTTDQDFDQSEVISRLSSLENKQGTDRTNTVRFGLEDENGNTIRVTIPADQEDQFEQALRAYLADAQEKNKEIEPAEVLFKLRDQFQIINVEWPEIEEDQEEATDAVAGAEEAGAEAGAEAGEEAGAEAGAEEMTAEAPPEETEAAKSILTQVIDMMKADAEAKKAEAEAKKAQAEADLEQTQMRKAMAKVKQEEQMLDMEEWEKSQKSAEKEAKQLARLAKFKHAMSKDQGGLEDEGEVDFGVEPEGEEMPAAEPTETTTTIGIKKTQEEEELARKVLDLKSKKATPAEIASFILKRVK